MESTKAKGKKRRKVEDEDSEEEQSLSVRDGCDKSKRGTSGYCQVENCSADITIEKRYHRRHKVCEYHAKASSAIIAGIPQRFCQQCSRFHTLSEFDDNKKSCRLRLAGHNERRRKTSIDNPSES